MLFDLLAWVTAGVTMRVLYRWRLNAFAAPTARALGLGHAAALAGGAISGAWLAGSLNTGLAHPSHSIAGGLAGGIVAVELWKWAKGIGGSTGVIWVGPLAAGIAVGRIGCFLAGLPDRTFGTATALPWGIDLGDGIARHPVALYESAAMLVFLAFYVAALRKRATWTRTRAFYLFVLFYAAQRFLWEFLKPYPRILGPLDVFQLLALLMIGYAITFDGRARRSL